MAVTSRHTLGALVFGGTGAFTLSQLTTRTVSPALNEFIARGAGQPGPSYVAGMFGEPMISASTSEIARFLTNVSLLTGLAVDSGGAGITSLDAYFTKMQQQSTRASGANNFKVGGFTKLLVVPQQLSAMQDRPADLTFNIVPISNDGTTAPWSYTASVALPATPAVDEQFTLGPSFINGVQIAGLIGFTYDFGLKVSQVRSDGNEFGTYISIDEQEPRITLKTEEVANLSTFGLKGTAASAACNFYLRKMLKNSMRTADATIEHIKFTVASGQGYIYCKDFTTPQNRDVDGDICIVPSVAASPLVSVSTAIAITT